MLNLAFNRIESVDGLALLHGPEFALSTVDLRGNAVATAAGLTALAGLSHLSTLYLGDGAAANPVVGAVARIRAELFGSVPSLTAIDGKDAQGATVPSELEGDGDPQPQVADDFLAELLASPPVEPVAAASAGASGPLPTQPSTDTTTGEP